MMNDELHLLHFILGSNSLHSFYNIKPKTSISVWYVVVSEAETVILCLAWSDIAQENALKFKAEIAWNSAKAERDSNSPERPVLFPVQKRNAAIFPFFPF